MLPKKYYQPDVSTPECLKEFLENNRQRRMIHSLSRNKKIIINGNIVLTFLGRGDSQHKTSQRLMIELPGDIEVTYQKRTNG